MSLIISGTTSTGVTLAPGNDPVSIGAAGYLNNSTNGLIALVGPTGTAWNVLNAGVIAGRSEGIDLYSAGTVTNRVAGMISGSDYGIFMNRQTLANGDSAAAAVTNAGLITTNGTAGVGIRILPAGAVTNLSTGTISGQKSAIEPFSALTLSNAGLITTPNGYGIRLRSGGGVTNLSSGTISGGNAIVASYAPVLNAGLVSGNQDAILFLTDTVVINQVTGTIAGHAAGVVLRSGGTILNDGLVTATAGYGVQAGYGGTITNQSNGTISGSFAGITFAKSGDTVANAGTIGGKSAISMHGGSPNRVIVSPGAVFVGVVNGGNGYGSPNYASTLELATGSAAGLIAGLGSQFTAFAQTTIDAGAQWTMTGANTLAAGATLGNSGLLTLLNGSLSGVGSVLNNGLIEVDAAALTTARLAGTGNVTIGGGGTLTVTASLAATETIALGAGGVLQVLNTLTNAGTIAGGGANGVKLTAGGTVTNRVGASISGYYGVVINGGTGTVSNAGLVAGQNQYGYAIYLFGGGGVTNQNDGSIRGGRGGIAISGGTGTVGNAGTVSNPGGALSGYAIYLHAGGAVSNSATGTISGNHGGIEVNGTLGSLINAGSIAGNNKVGIFFEAGGSVANQSGATISGRYGGIYVSGASGTVTNAGVVTGSLNTGVQLFKGGTLANQLGGLISGTSVGVSVGLTSGSGTVTNAGTILAGAYYGAGVFLHAGGAVSVLSGGTIGAAGYGATGVLAAGGASTVTNAGVISGATAAVSLAAGFTNRVIVNAGGSFAGRVDGGNTIGATASSTLELASGATAGVISGLGSQFVDFAQTTVDMGALWTLTGANALPAGASLANGGVLTIVNGGLSDAGAVNNNGLIQVDAAAVTIGSLSGSGTLVIGTGGSVTVAGSIPATQRIIFNGGGQLALTSTVAARFAGEFAVASGATVTSQAVTDVVSGAAANIMVNGTAAVWSSAGQLRVGDDAPGTFAVRAGATATAGNGAVIAGSASGSGSGVTVSGAGSRLEIAGSLAVGIAGFGAMSLDSGATVVAGSLATGESAAAVGQISAIGDKSRLAITGDATVAGDGTGVLSVLNGATFSAANLTIGATGNSSGALVVSGSGSEINLAGAINIGTALGTGDLTIGRGAAVHASVVNLQGEVVLEGGLLDPTVSVINQAQTASGFGTLVADDIVDEGVIQAGGSTPSQKLLIVQGTVLGGGTLSKNGTTLPSSPAGILQISPGGTMELTGAVLNGGSQDALTPNGTYTINNSVIDVTFADSTGVLLLDDIAGFAGTVTASRPGDSFVIAGGTLSNVSVISGSTLAFSDSGPNAGAGGIDRIIFGGVVDAANFAVRNGNTMQIACFAAGTRIDGIAGPVRVEDLSAGDLVRSHGGETRAIVWIDCTTIDCRRHPNPESVWPVCVSAGALGKGMPRRDLYLSPDHAVLVGDVLIPARLLIDGARIAQKERDTVSYFHVELKRHDIILAEGLPVESYLEPRGGRRVRDAGETIRLPARAVTRPAMSAAQIWETDGAAPLVVTGRTLLAARESVGRSRTFVNETRRSGA
jgi:T5SS/PEP-CTERM-associated repeat protein